LRAAVAGVQTDFELAQLFCLRSLRTCQHAFHHRTLLIGEFELFPCGVCFDLKKTTCR
jgi:hypothetical protein